ncbi:hypothetical protein [Treponema putidum]|uniref:hypothetical protein n=1 Tax=Treponema putidum TaxID=221027 RepID=UPI003D93130E
MQIKTLDSIRLFLGRKLPVPIFKILLFFRIIYKNIRMHEQKKSFGKLHPDKTFYVIRLYPPATGWLANYNYILGYIKHAFDRGLIPIVDMEHYATLYTEDKPVNGTKNVWEYFFKQPTPYTLEEVYTSKNVILSNGSLPLCDTSMNPDVLQWQMKITKLVPFNKIVQSHIEKNLKNILPKGKRVLGVAARGSDLNQRLIGHHIQITAHELLPIIKQKIVDWKIDYVYVVTEDQETIEFFTQHLSNVIFLDIERLGKTEKDTSSMVSTANQTGKYRSLLNYQTSVYILSQCSCLLGTLSNGIYTALLWNQGKAEQIEIIDKGIYR